MATKKKKIIDCPHEVSVFIETKEVESSSEDKEFGDWYSEQYSKQELVDCYAAIATVRQKDDTSPWPTKTLSVDFTPKRGMKVFVLLESYSDGDTFGQSGGNISVIGVYKNRLEALQRQAIPNNYGYFGYHEFWIIKAVTLE